MAGYDEKTPDDAPLAPSDGRRRSGDNSAAGDLARREGLKQPLSNEHEDRSNTAVGSPGLSKAEQQSSNGLGGTSSPYTIGPGFVQEGSSSGSKGSGFKKVFLGSKVRRNGTITAIIVLLLFGGGFGASLYFSGPFEFVQVSKVLEGLHLTSQENEQNDRFLKEVRFIRYTSTGQGQLTRLKFLGNKFANAFEAKLNATGLSSSYSSRYGFFDGYVIDTDNARFKGMDDAQIKQFFQENYGLPVVEGDTLRGSGGVKLAGQLVLDTSDLGFIQTQRLTFGLLSEAGYSDLPAALGMRLLTTRDGISFHPLSNLDTAIYRTIDARITEYQKQRAAQVEEGNQGAAVQSESNPSDQGQSTKEQQTTQATADANNDAANATLSEGNAANVDVNAGNSGPLTALTQSIHLKIAAGGAAAIGVLCLAQGLAKESGQVKETQTVLPLIRMGAQAITTGNQVMSGEDIDANELSADSQQLYGKDSEGNMTSWSSAQSIQSEEGTPNTGQAPDSTLQTINSGTPFDFLNEAPASTILGGVCSTAGEFLVSVVSFIGGPASFIVGTVIGASLLPTFEHDIAHWIAGAAVDPNAVGADYGNDIDYGTELLANDQAIASGGRQLTSQESGQLADANNQQLQTDFQDKSLAYRLFSPTDYRSLLASIMDKLSPVASEDVASFASYFTHIGSSIASITGSLFSSLAHAQTTTPYNYGFPQFGFSEAELNNPLVDNPYQNADAVASILSSPAGPDYISMAQSCFGINIVQEPTYANNQMEELWGVTSQNTPLYFKNIPSSCSSDNDPNWLQIRFFIMDTETMESMACYEGDDQSCNDIGFTDSGTSTQSNSNGIYVIGDSISAGMENEGDLQQKLSVTGWNVTQIDATTGINVENSIANIQTDSSNVESAGTVLVELGTNDCALSQQPLECESTATFEQNIQNMVQAIRNVNPSAQIDWVNIYTTKGSVTDSINQALTDEAGSLNYKVIDWATEAQTNASKYSFDTSLGVHQTTSTGYSNMSNFIVSSLGAP